MDQDRLQAWLISTGLPQERAEIVSNRFKVACKKNIDALSLDDLENLANELITKYNFK